ncbi:MAG: HEAT repeat domain-containing protein [Synechococcales cyanobacterium RU_4_20]|nr:HEAT repeat domain-containing protein [Synechococcales cyanobacterium RU_4_20]NJR68303.1 HEAT repeat domain-containing protein [Synechococcales cyanobacterium CRU_2_2]
MNLEQIKLDLTSTELQARLRALTALQAFDTATAVPLLCSRLEDGEYLVRLGVAIGLGRKRSPQAYQALESLLQDSEASVRAEAVLSLSRFGLMALNTIINTFRADTHALVRGSILEAIAILPLPLELFKICSLALADEDVALQEAAVLAFGQFAKTEMQTAALDHLQPLAQSRHAVVRAALARSLHAFDNYRARELLKQLHDDTDHRVVAAVLEGLIS